MIFGRSESHAYRLDSPQRGLQEQGNLCRQGVQMMHILTIQLRHALEMFRDPACMSRGTIRITGEESDFTLLEQCKQGATRHRLARLAREKSLRPGLYRRW